MREKSPNPIPTTTSEADSFWRNIKEKVSSSPSGMYMGVYKAALSNKIKTKNPSSNNKSTI